MKARAAPVNEQRIMVNKQRVVSGQVSGIMYQKSAVEDIPISNVFLIVYQS